MITQKMDLDVMTLQDLFGVTDTNLHALEQELAVSVVTHEGTAEIRGENEETVSRRRPCAPWTRCAGWGSP